MASIQPRKALHEAKRIVVKIGSRALVSAEGRFASLAAQIDGLRRQGRHVVLVSSGAVAAGRKRLKLTERPKEVAQLQAVAATGQSLLMRSYEDVFEPRGVHVAQVLLTHHDLSDRARFLNARLAVDALLSMGVLPIINENDAVSVEELTFGDNDQLAAMVCNLVGADLLVLLSDVEGVLDDRGARVSLVQDVQEVTSFLRAPQSDESLGGMMSKVEAARRATLHGVPVVIGAAANQSFLASVVGGEDVGTLLLPHGAPLASRKYWIAYTLKPKGQVRVDEGAKDALIRMNRSLLPAGVVSVHGDFLQGDAVAVVDDGGLELARGLVRYGSSDMRAIIGCHSDRIAEKVRAYVGDEVIHRDDLVLVGVDAPDGVT